MDQLKKAIEKKREEMIQLGMTKGFTHPETVKASQELDRLLDKYMEGKGQ